MSKKFSILCVLAFVFVSPVLGQDDESRQQSGLPTYIGVRPGNTSMGLVDATLSGTVTVQGLNEARPHTITVSVLVNGVTFARPTLRIAADSISAAFLAPASRWWLTSTARRSTGSLWLP